MQARMASSSTNLASLIHCLPRHPLRDDMPRQVVDARIAALRTHYEACSAPGDLDAALTLLGLTASNATLGTLCRHVQEARRDLEGVYYQALRHHLVWGDDPRTRVPFSHMARRLACAFETIAARLGAPGLEPPGRTTTALALLAPCPPSRNEDTMLFHWLAAACGHLGLARLGSILYQENVIEFKFESSEVALCWTGTWVPYAEVDDFVGSVCQFASEAIQPWCLLNRTPDTRAKVVEMLQAEDLVELPILERDPRVVVFLGAETKEDNPRRALGAGRYHLITDSFVPFGEPDRVAGRPVGGMACSTPFCFWEFASGTPIHPAPRDASYWASLQPMLWATPVFDSIFRVQGHSDQVLHTIMALLGRCLIHPEDRVDSWSLLPFFHDPSGWGGNSDLQWLVCAIIGDDWIHPVVASLAEVASSKDKAAWIGLNLGASNALEYHAAALDKTAIPGLMFGYRLPAFIEDRRLDDAMVVVRLHQETIVPHRYPELRSELPVLVRKMNVAYWQFAMEHGADFWAGAPPSLRWGSTHPLKLKEE
jgi:hypothetical protein